MVYVLLLLIGLGSLGLMLGLTTWAFRSKKRKGAWIVPAVAALLLAFVGAFAAMSFVIALFGELASADAASRATMLARAISEAMNATSFVCVTACPLLLAFASYRFYLSRKTKSPRA